jgi:hypothetical protein
MIAATEASGEVYSPAMIEAIVAGKAAAR